MDSLARRMRESKKDESYLTQAEATYVDQVFSMSGDPVNGWRLRIAIEKALHVNPSDAEIDALVKLYADEEGNFSQAQFKEAVSAHKANGQTPQKQAELLAAFVALGGKADKTGTVNGNMLIKLLRDDFGMAFKEEELRGDESSTRTDLDYQSFVHHFG